VKRNLGSGEKSPKDCLICLFDVVSVIITQDMLFCLNRVSDQLKTETAFLSKSFSRKQVLAALCYVRKENTSCRKTLLLTAWICICVGFVWLSPLICFDRETSIIFVLVNNGIIDSHSLTFCERQIKYDPFHGTPR
jgi:hypothetical protein